MIFVDANVFISHVGRGHHLRDEAREFVRNSLRRRERLVTSAEVLQELLYFYHRMRRWSVLEDAFTLVEQTVEEVWSVDRTDVDMARSLMVLHPGLEARDLVHLACCIRRQPRDLMTFDRGLKAAWEARR